MAMSGSEGGWSLPLKDLKPSTCFSPGAALLSPANSSDQNSLLAQLAIGPFLHGIYHRCPGARGTGEIVRRSIEVLKPLCTTGATKAARRAAVTAVLWRNMAIDVFFGVERIGVWWFDGGRLEGRRISRSEAWRYFRRAVA